MAEGVDDVSVPSLRTSMKSVFSRNRRQAGNSVEELTQEGDHAIHEAMYRKRYSIPSSIALWFGLESSVLVLRYDCRAVNIQAPVFGRPPC